MSDVNATALGAQETGFVPVSLAMQLCYAIAFALPPAMAWFVLGSVSNVPIYDEWLWSPLMVAMHDGTLQFSQLWQQQNSHRSVVPTALALGLAALTHWDTRFEALLSVLLIVVAQLCFLALLIRDRGKERAARPFLIASLLLYSLAQVENLLWGFQLSWFLVDALVMVMILSLAPRERAPGVLRIAAAGVCAVAASYSMIFGFGTWIAGAAMIASTRRRLRIPLLLVWSVAAFACAGAYFHNYVRPPDEHGWFAEAAAPARDVPQFVLAVLGSPLGLVGGRWLCEVLGAASIVAFALLLMRTASDRRAHAPWIATFAFAVAVAAFIALGRTAYGVDAAVISRYSTPASFAWIALVAMAPLTLRTRRTVFVLGGALFVVTASAGLFVSWQIAGEQRDLAMRVRHIASASDAELRRAFTNNYGADQPAFVRAQVRDLERSKLGPFATAAPDATRTSSDRVGFASHLPQPVVVPEVAPRILGVALDRPIYRWGDLVHIEVVTTTNTAAVEVTTFANIPMKLPFRLHQTGLGEFSGLLRIPFEPPLVHVPTVPFIVDVTALGGDETFASRRLALDLASAQ